MTADMEQRLETLEENVKSLPELVQEKDGNKALQTKVQGIETTVKQLKVLVENSAKDVRVEEMELLPKERDQLDNRSEKMPEEHKKVIKESSDSNNNAQKLNEIACREEGIWMISPLEEIVVVTDRIPDSSLDKETPPVNLMESKFGGKFAVLVFSYLNGVIVLGNTKDTILLFPGILIFFSAVAQSDIHRYVICRLGGPRYSEKL